jgi:hypothetical protein
MPTTGEALVAQTILKKGTRVTGAERDRLAADLKKRYDSGGSIRALAAATGRSYGFIHRILTESGVNLRGRGGERRGPSTRGRKTPPGRLWCRCRWPTSQERRGRPVGALPRGNRIRCPAQRRRWRAAWRW